MTDGPDVLRTGERIESLLAGLRERADAATVEAAEELVRCVVDLYGEGLTRLVAVWPAGHDGLTSDPLVESLLLLHDLHPLDVDARIERALDRVRPYLGSHAGDVDYLGVDSDGVAQLQLRGSCDGCASSARTVELAIESAVLEAAPEVTGIKVAGVAAPTRLPLLQIGSRPPDGDTRVGAPAGSNGSGANGGGAWALFPDRPPQRGGTLAADVGPVRVLVCDVRGTLYAYLDVCPICHGPLDGAGLVGQALACPGCGADFDVLHAGAALDGRPDHLDPIPLLIDGRGVHLAVPAGASP
jgi:Fe-S cluster biogenesis protein NfuA/nitrite reductase/ring-hydroxylating ferredoxin subunit